MPACPRCQTIIPRKRLIFVTRFTRLKCEICGAEMKPTRESLERNRYPGPILSGFAIAIVIKIGNLWIWGFWISIVFAVLVVLLTCIIVDAATINRLRFESAE